jgi:hypothetical protein
MHHPAHPMKCSSSDDGEVSIKAYTAPKASFPKAEKEALGSFAPFGDYNNQ